MFQALPPAGVEMIDAGLEMIAAGHEIIAVEVAYGLERIADVDATVGTPNYLWDPPNQVY